MAIQRNIRHQPYMQERRRNTNISETVILNDTTINIYLTNYRVNTRKMGVSTGCEFDKDFLNIS